MDKARQFAIVEWVQEWLTPRIYEVVRRGFSWTGEIWDIELDQNYEYPQQPIDLVQAMAFMYEPMYDAYLKRISEHGDQPERENQR